jgi:cytochrome c oxidase subunit 3
MFNFPFLNKIVSGKIENKWTNFFSTSSKLNSNDLASPSLNATLPVERHQFQSFPFHLVTPSPWPIVTSFSLLIMTLSSVLYFQGFYLGGEFLFLGFVLTASAMTLWFNDVVIEGTYLGDHTSQVQAGLNLGVILFIVSEVFAFLSVFWAFFHSSLAPTIEINSWPPLGIQVLDPFAVPLLNTILLLSSGAFITWGHHALIQGNRKGTIIGTALTIVLALIFTGLQYFEYSEASFSMADSVYGTCFYASTGLHGIHVIVGTIFIAVAFLRIINYHVTDSHHLGFEASILYWHQTPKQGARQIELYARKLKNKSV